MVRTKHDDLTGSDDHRLGDVKRFLRLPAVIEATGLARSTLYEKIAAGEFPAPVKISPRLSGWIDREVADWQSARIAERDDAEVK